LIAARALEQGVAMVGLGIAALREEFPSADAAIHFDHAAVGPISRRVADAMQRVCAEYVAGGFQNSWRNDIEHVRAQAATLVGSQLGNIAFTQNTSTGLSIAANGLEWAPGDNVVLPEREFPSNFYPWLNLEPRGVRLRRVPAPDGHASIEAIADAIDERTRVVTVSTVQFSSGHRYDLDAIGELCRRHGALFVVDGTQSVGALMIDVDRSSIDVLAVSAHKWMLGPSGIGFVHVSDRALGCIRPDVVGWLSVTEPFAFDYRLELPSTADRYEPGTENVFGIVGLGAAISLFLEHGTHEVEDRVLSLTDHLCEQLHRIGCEVVSPRDGRQRSGIVIFTKPGTSAGDLHGVLTTAGVKCSQRGGGIRVSPHCYNTHEEIDTAIAAIT
jgi:selenocysteine lyase/cysteine desulfurase